MSGAGGGDGAGRKPDHPEASGGAKVSLLAKWRWVRQVAADREVPREMLHTAFAVADLVNAELGFAFAGQAYIAGVVGVSDRSVGVHLQRLVAAGHLGVTRRGKAGASHYRLLQKGVEAPDCGGPHEPKPASDQNGSQEAHEPKPASGQSDLWQDYEPKPDVIMNRSRLRTNKLKNKRSESASPPRRGGGHANGSAVMADPEPVPDRPKVVPAVAADGVSDLVDFQATPAVADAYAARRRREAEWRRLLQHDGCITQSDASPVHSIIDDGLATEAEVLAEIEALTRSTFRPRLWGGVRKFVLDEIGKRKASTPRPIAVLEREPDRPAGAIEIPGSGWRTVAQFEEHRRRWDMRYTWDEAQFGPPPDSEFTLCPPELRGPRKPRPAAADGPVDAVQNGASGSTVQMGEFR